MTETRGRPIANHTKKGQSRRDQYRTLRGAWLCAWGVSCGETAAIGSPYCAEHRAAVNAANRRMFSEKKAADRCRNCGTQVIGRSRCWLCSQRRKAYASRQPEYRKAKECGKNGEYR